jgi:hypothetical protein
MKAQLNYILSTLVMLFFVTGSVQSQNRPDLDLLDRMYNYSSTVDTTSHEFESYTYTKSTFNVKKRNIALLAVPTMYAIAHRVDRRQYLSETFSRVHFYRLDSYDSKPILHFSTIPHQHGTLTRILPYLKPKIYDETIVGNNLLSPFCKTNRKYYKYSVKFLLNGTANITYSPVNDNTQLVKGQAIVDYESGRVISTILDGEFDMVHFSLGMNMGDEGLMSLVPTDVRLNSRFNFLGSRTEANLRTLYGLGKPNIDSIAKNNDIQQMANVRPVPLTIQEQFILDDHIERLKDEEVDSVNRKNRWVKDVLWDRIGDNLLNRIKGTFGMQNQGYLRINPLLNPLYMGYDNHRGFVYKFDIRLNYEFTRNSEINARFNSGYSFKRKQLYYKLPVTYYYNKKRNGYIQAEIGNGNWIKNGNALKAAEEAYIVEHGDSLSIKYPKMIYFKDKYFRITNNYDISKNWSILFGVIFHCRNAVEKYAYQLVGLPDHYTSSAPNIQLQWRPTGWNGMFLTLDYERSFENFLGANIAYERIELDAQQIKRLSRLQALKIRAGAGGYTYKHGPSYFLDYSNFRENYIPGGWNDDWSGGFELLNSDYYNNSKYYVRGNLTYEAPLLLAAHIPWIGHFFEMERLYSSALWAKDIHPYIELGYGFTTRLLSAGVFVNNKNGKFESFGVKMGLELFRHW